MIRMCAMGVLLAAVLTLPAGADFHPNAIAAMTDQPPQETNGGDRPPTNTFDHVITAGVFIGGVVLCLTGLQAENKAGGKNADEIRVGLGALAAVSGLIMFFDD